MTELTLLFDLDGTLADTATDIATALDAMLAEYGKPAAGLERLRTWIGGGAPLLVKRALIANDLPATEAHVEAAMAVFMPCYAESNATDTRLYPGVAESLAALGERGVSMAVVTNKPYRFAIEVLEHLDIAKRFKFTIGGDSLPEKKPDARPLHEALARLGGDPGQSWMIGDSATDVNAALNAGVKSAWVPYGYHGGHTAAELAPTRVLQDFTEVLELD